MAYFRKPIFAFLHQEKQKMKRKISWILVIKKGGLLAAFRTGIIPIRMNHKKFCTPKVENLPLTIIPT